LPISQFFSLLLHTQIPTMAADSTDPATNATQEQAQAQQPQSATDAQSQPKPLEDWSELQHVSALAHLETLQDQLDLCRNVISRIINSLTLPYEDPEHMFRNVKDNIWSGSERLALFRQTWESAKTREVMMRTKASLAADDNMWGYGRLSVYDWIEKEEKMRKEEATKAKSESPDAVGDKT
jgi:hypothetical protein